MQRFVFLNIIRVRVHAIRAGFGQLSHSRNVSGRSAGRVVACLWGGFGQLEPSRLVPSLHLA
jgi:hypothetical protein